MSRGYIHKWPTVGFVEGESPWTTYFKKQVFQRNNCINSVWTGQPGSGKSWAMLAIAEQIDPDFTLEGNWFFRASELFKGIKEWVHSGTKPGKQWWYDEAGIDLNNLKYFDEVNKGFNAFFQTARHRNYIFGCSVPYMAFISKGVRTLMNCHMTAQGWTTKNKTRILARYLEYNGELQKFYKKRLLIKKEDVMYYCNKIMIKRPSKKLVKEYESLKKEFTGDLFQNIYKKVSNFEEKERTKNMYDDGFLTKGEERVLIQLKQGKTVPKIKDALFIASQAIYAHMKGIKKKGIEIIPIYKKDGKALLRYDIIDKRINKPL